MLTNRFGSHRRSADGRADCNGGAGGTDADCPAQAPRAPLDPDASIVERGAAVANQAASKGATMSSSGLVEAFKEGRVVRFALAGRTWFVIGVSLLPLRSGLAQQPVVQASRPAASHRRAETSTEIRPTIAARYAAEMAQPAPAADAGNRPSIAGGYAAGAPAAPATTFSPAIGPVFNSPVPWNVFKPAVAPVYGGADYLFLRMHFSEAIAFVNATDSLSGGLPTEQVQARELNFSYNSAFRTFLGYNLTPTSAVQLTYFHFNTNVAVNDTVTAPNQYDIDAYGDKAGPGQTIATNAFVHINAFDLDYVRPYLLNRGLVGVRLNAGMRWADVRQHYDSTVFTTAGGVQGSGNFNTHFIGYGPHLGLQAQARRHADSRFSLLARTGGSLLVGGYNVSSGAVFPGVAAGGQSANRTLVVPVYEAELGVAWQPTQSFTFSAGWLFQAWFDLGVSGGTDGGKFTEVDDSNIMSFDGLFLRGIWRY
jgi:hypothetical protein